MIPINSIWMVDLPGSGIYKCIAPLKYNPGTNNSFNNWNFKIIKSGEPVRNIKGYTSCGDWYGYKMKRIYLYMLFYK